MHAKILIKSRERVLAFLVLVASIGAISLKLSGAVTSGANSPRVNWPESRATQLVFFAVLEGLFHDGVANDDVDLIIPPDKDGKPMFDKEHFVYACPLCHPAFEAFRLYRQRVDFFGMKLPVNTFGPGLAPDVRKDLRSPDAEQRRHAIEALIQRWVSQRLDMMRLSAEERAAISKEIEQGRKRGMGELKGASVTRTNCPICDGSFGACRLSGH